VWSRLSWLPALAVAGALVGAWQAAAAAGLINFESIAAPKDIVSAWWRLTIGGPLLEQTWHTISMFAVSWTIALALGTTIGTAVGLSNWAGRLTLGTVTFFRFLPPPALVPLVLLIFGLSSSGELTIATYVAIWPVILNTTIGVQQVDPRLIEVGRTLQLGKFVRLRKLIVPAALPMILAGARLASTLALVVVVTAEMVGIPAGIGHEIVRSAEALRPDSAYAYVVWTGALGMAINLALRRLERGALAWQSSGSPP